jgi:hypothetical protein
MMNLKLTLIILIITAFSMILTSISLVQISNAVNSINPNTIDCNSKKGTADTFAGPLKYGGVKCEGQNDGTASAGGIRSTAINTNTTSTGINTIDCNSKKGTADTFAGPLKYGGVKCEGQNGGTASAGGIKSNSGSIGIHGIIGPNDNSHLTTNLRR